MSGINGTNIASGIVPFDTADTFATHYAKYGMGGWKSVATDADRNAIPTSRLEDGSVVYVVADALAYVYVAGVWTSLTAALSTAIANEITRAETAETSLGATIASETSIRSGAITTINSALSGEISRAEAAEGTLTTNLSNEITRAEAAEATLTSAIASEATTRGTAVTTINAAIAAEIARAEGVEGTLSTAISTEATNRASAITSTNTAISNEATRAQAAEATLTTNLASEASTRTTAVAVLTSQLSSETTRAQGAESTISTNLTSEVTRATGAESTLNGLISTETANRVSAVTAANTAITNEVTRAQAAEATLTSSLATEATTRGTAITAANTAITAETTRATAAEATLTANLASEITRATAAESSITTSAQAAAVAAVTPYVTQAAASANLALTAGSVGNPYVNAAATYVPQGVAAYSLTSGGTGGTANLTNQLATYSGGTLTVNPTIRFDTNSSGVVVNIRLVSPGLYIGSGTPTMPTVTFPGAAGSPAIVLTAGTIVPLGGTYWAASADSKSIQYWSNTAGSPAPVANPNGTQILIPNIAVIAGLLAVINPGGVQTIAGLSAAITDAVGNRTWLEANATDGGPSPLSLNLMAKYSPQASIASVPGVSVAHSDSAGNRTWLEANSTDGGPTPLGIQLLGAHTSLPISSPITNLSVAITDAGNNRTWLEADNISGGPSMLSLSLFSQAKITNAKSQINCVGHSMVYGNHGYTGSWPQNLAALLGRNVVNNGISGETSVEVAIRAGGFVPLLTFPGGTLPASTASVTVTTNITTTLSASGQPTRTYSVTIRGVPCTLSYTTTTGVWTIARNIAGTALLINPTCPVAAIPVTPYSSFLQIGWFARNDNPVSGAYGPAAATIAQWQTWGVPFLIISECNDGAEPAGSSGYSNLIGYNAQIEALAPSNYVDMRGRMIREGLALAGLTPTSGDTAAIANDQIPPSLLWSGDGLLLHFNQSGDIAAGLIIQDELKQRGYA